MRHFLYALIKIIFFVNQLNLQGLRFLYDTHIDLRYFIIVGQMCPRLGSYLIPHLLHVTNFDVSCMQL